jgi:hypothetical protein
MPGMNKFVVSFKKHTGTQSFIRNTEIRKSLKTVGFDQRHSA